MVFHGALALVLLVGLAGCASFEVSRQGADQPTPYPPSVFAHRIANSDLVLFWNCARSDSGVLRLEGVAQNPWHAQPIRYLEFELVGVDAQDHIVTQTTRFVARDVCSEAKHRVR